MGWFIAAVVAVILGLLSGGFLVMAWLVPAAVFGAGALWLVRASGASGPADPPLSDLTIRCPHCAVTQKTWGTPGMDVECTSCGKRLHIPLRKSSPGKP